jgi:signal transduction histidine kinase
LGSRDEITFHALPPGDHRLQLRGRTPGRPWSETTPLVLHVAPPLWQRAEVRFGALGAVLLLVVAALAFRTRVLGQKNHALRALQLEREQALELAQAGRDHLRRLSQRLQSAEEEERKRLARELHDEFGQALTAVKLSLGLAAATADPSARRLNDSVSVIDGLITQVRALSVDLRPPQLDELGLVSALENHLRSAARTSGVEIVVTSAATLPSLGDHDIVVFRVVQGAVTNALRHSGAQRIEVRLEAAGSGIRLEVRDGGKGFDPHAVLKDYGSAHFGLFAMQERVRDLGGRFEVISQQGAGTVISAELPSQALEEEPA